MLVTFATAGVEKPRGVFRMRVKGQGDYTLGHNSHLAVARFGRDPTQRPHLRVRQSTARKRLIDLRQPPQRPRNPHFFLRRYSRDTATPVEPLSTVVVAEITKNLAMANDPACLFIDINTPEGQSTGLVRDSVISCVLLVTVYADTVAQVLGTLSMLQMQKLDQCLRAGLGLT